MTHSVEHSGDILTKHYTSWSRGEPTREWAALSLVSRETSDLVPTPLATSTDVRPWVSMTVLPGQPLAGALGPRELEALGDALETLWSVSPDGLPPVDLDALVDRTRTALTRLRSADGVIGEAACAWLATDPLADIQEPVVAHGDPNLANYLWDGTRIRIVDFEDAGRGDRTVELANLVEHLAGRQTDWSPVVRRFDVDPERFRAARSLWAGFWLTLIGPGGPSADRNPAGTAEEQAGRVLRLVAGAS
jgi:aminoglycoside phosphotransferase (APT) family kinase protein